MNHPYRHLEATPCWKNADRAFAHLIGNGDVELLTLPPYVIGYLCQQMAEAHSAGDDEEEADLDERPPYYRHSASLRITAEALNFEDISGSLGLDPTYTHRKGERRSAAAPPYKHDMWSYKVALQRELELDQHLLALAEALLPAADYLRALRDSCSVEVFATYTSNSHTAGFVIGSRSLRVFDEIGIDLGVSTVIV